MEPRRTPEQQAMLVEYVTTLQHALGLGHWLIYVEDVEPTGDDDTPAEKTEAETFPRSYGFVASIRVTSDLFGQDPDNARRCVLHELLHLHLHHWVWDIEHTVEKIGVSAVARDLLNNGYERVVDAIAQAIAPQYPLPPWKPE